MTRNDDALDSFRKGFTCSSAVFSAFSEEMGLDHDTAKKISCGFGAGISKTGNICGAVSGAIMVIGLKYGKTRQGDDASTNKTRALVRQFIQEFNAYHGSINCTDLLGFNLSKPDEFEQARNEKLFTTKCPLLVQDAVTILESLIEGLENSEISEP
jgi:C_GCAxxG_C_C family probable redox protein